MKIRQSFISNSSSTSFVLMGNFIPQKSIPKYMDGDSDEDIEKQDELQDAGLIDLGNFEVGKNRYVFGEILCMGDDYNCFNAQSFDQKKLSKLAKIAKTNAKKFFGINITPQLIIGTMSS